MKAGVIGLGVMGYRVAANLASKGILSRVHNRATKRAEDFEKEFGVTASPNVREVAEKCDVIFTVLSDDGAVRDVIGTLAPHLQAGKMVADMSTIAPTTSIEIARTLSSRKVLMFDSPIVGSSLGLEKREAVILVGGEQEEFEKIGDVLRSITKEVLYVGPNGSGLRLKLVHNLVLGSYVAALAEAVHFGLGAGLRPDAIEKLLVSLSSIRSPNSAIKVPKILNSDYSTQFSLTYGERSWTHRIRGNKAAFGHSTLLSFTSALQISGTIRLVRTRFFCGCGAFQIKRIENSRQLIRGCKIKRHRN